MAYRARKTAKEVVQGDQRAQYTRIRDYLQAVLDTNPGSRCIVTTKHLKTHPSINPRFHGLFMCLNACKEGFLNGCRPFTGTCIIIFPTYFPTSSKFGKGMMRAQVDEVSWRRPCLFFATKSFLVEMANKGEVRLDGLGLNDVPLPFL